MTPDVFRQQHPDAFLLETGERSELEAYLRTAGILLADELLLDAGPAGEGNMNLTLRVRTSERSLIVKQSRPWVERYPSIAAPWDRVLSEARFYELTSPAESIKARMPRMIAIDAEARLLVLEDLGESLDYTRLYAGERLPSNIARELINWLSDLHSLSFDGSIRATLTNREMRELNHEHLFRFPLDRDNGFDLDAITPGLREAASELASDAEYVDRVTALGDAYLSDGRVLLHGDFFPGSWLDTDGGPAVIDPEFAFFGPPEFDVGVLLGHLHLSRQPDAVHASVREGYRPPPGFDWRLAEAFAGVEIMRRLIGVAQLPLSVGLEEKRELLERSRQLVVGEE